MVGERAHKLLGEQRDGNGIGDMLDHPSPIFLIFIHFYLLYFYFLGMGERIRNRMELCFKDFTINIIKASS